MDIKITEIRNPRWANVAHTLIDVEVQFSHMPEEWVWFTASPNDTTSYGVDIYNKAIEGKFGQIRAKD